MSVTTCTFAGTTPRTPRTSGFARWRKSVASAAFPLTPDAKTHALTLNDEVCVYCGSDRSAPFARQLDHVTSVRKGGQSTPENLVPSCASCNARKGNMTGATFRLMLEVIAEEGAAADLAAADAITLLGELALMHTPSLTAADIATIDARIDAGIDHEAERAATAAAAEAERLITQINRESTR